MPWSGSGTFNRLLSWVSDATAGIDINATRMDTDTDDIVTGLNNTRTLDGQTEPTANLPMNGFKHTGAAAASASGQYLEYGQTSWSLSLGTFTNGAGFLDTSAALNVTIGFTSSVTLTAGRALTVDVANGNRTLKMTGNAVLNQDVSSTGAPTFSGATISTGGQIILSGTASIGGGGSESFGFFNGSCSVTGVNTGAGSEFYMLCPLTANYPTNIAQFYFNAAAPNSSTPHFWDCIDSSATRASLLSNGGLANFSANNVNLSDATVKTDIQSLRGLGLIQPMWDAHKSVDWCRYEFKDQTHDDWNAGYTAQEIKRAFSRVAPELVGSWGDPEAGKLGVYHDDLHNIAHAVLSEAQLRIEALEAEIAAMKASKP